MTCLQNILLALAGCIYPLGAGLFACALHKRFPDCSRRWLVLMIAAIVFWPVVLPISAMALMRHEFGKLRRSDNVR